MAKEPQTRRAWAGFSGSKTGSGTTSRSERSSAFETAVLIHLDAAYTFARYLTRRSDTAEDIVQEALLRAYRSFENQRGGNVRAWLLTIVRNCFLTWQARDRQNFEDREFHEERALNADEDTETPESILIQRETNSTMRSLLAELPQPFREVLVLRDIEDMSYREIADITGVPLGTVMSRLARARKMFTAAWKGLEMKVSEEKLP